MYSKQITSRALNGQYTLRQYILTLFSMMTIFKVAKIALTFISINNFNRMLGIFTDPNEVFAPQYSSMHYLKISRQSGLTVVTLL